MSAIDLILLALGAAALGELVLYVFMTIRAVREIRHAPFVSQALRGPQPAAWPRVSVIVPAHNEQRVAAECARSILASDYPDFELIFVLDRCTDGTRAGLEPIAAADPRLRIVDNHDCPPDWAGKCNAARVGAAHAHGELLLFADADTLFTPSLLRGSVAMLRARGWRMLSLYAAPTHEHWFERVVQPVASVLLLKLFPLRRANNPQRRRAFANGQFMFFERSAYEQLGGHAAVKDDLLEDLGFARALHRAGIPLGVGVSEGLLQVRMYDSWAAFRSGWRRIYIESCVRNPERLRTQALQMAGAYVLLPLLRVATVVLAAWALWGSGAPHSDVAAPVLGLALAAWVARTGALLLVYRFCRFPLTSVLFNSMGAAAVAAICWQGSRDLINRVPVRWGGRQYVLTPNRW